MIKRKEPPQNGTVFHKNKPQSMLCVNLIEISDYRATSLDASEVGEDGDVMRTHSMVQRGQVEAMKLSGGFLTTTVVMCRVNHKCLSSTVCLGEICECELNPLLLEATVSLHY